MLIQLSKVQKTYGRETGLVHALKSVDLEVSKGEYVSILGPSGSGKSTLLQILGCLDKPSQGSYQLDGTDVHQLDRNGLADVRNRSVGFVFQRFHLLPRASALENVALPLRFAGKDTDSRHARAQTLLEQVGLADRVTHRPFELSGGQQQRVAIARALANEAPLLLADEPTGNLDSKSGKEIIEILENLHADGRTIILVTHDENLAARTQRTIRLLDGDIIEDSKRE